VRARSSTNYRDGVPLPARSAALDRRGPEPVRRWKEVNGMKEIKIEVRRLERLETTLPTMSGPVACETC
jgi:hypothetical protein